MGHMQRQPLQRRVQRRLYAVDNDAMAAVLVVGKEIAHQVAQCPAHAFLVQNVKRLLDGIEGLSRSFARLLQKKADGIGEECGQNERKKEEVERSEEMKGQAPKKASQLV